MSQPFVVNRERFLMIVAALASSTCAEPRPASAPPAPESKLEMRGATEPDVEAEAEAEAAAEEPEVIEEKLEHGSAIRSACDNDVGEIDCSRIARHEIGPACEGLTGSCELLTKGYGFKRRVGEAIAKCWEGLGRKACNIKARERCNRQSLQSVCPDPRFEAQCQTALDRCKAARARVDYTLAECVQALSSLDDSNRDWAIGAMGPAAEGCRLMFPVY
jgi:hypothetical protein